MIDLKFCETASYHFADFFALIISAGSPASGGSAQLSNVTLLGFFEFSISAWVPRASPDPPQTTKTHDSKVQVGQKIKSSLAKSHESRQRGYFLQALYSKGGGQFHPLITPWSLFLLMLPEVVSCLTSSHKPSFLVGGKKLCKNLPIF